MKLSPAERRGAMYALKHLVEINGLLARNILPGDVENVDNREQVCRVTQHVVELCVKEILEELTSPDDAKPEPYGAEWSEVFRRMNDIDFLIDRARKFGIHVVATPEAYDLIAKSDAPEGLLENIHEVDDDFMFTEPRETSVAL